MNTDDVTINPRRVPPTKSNTAEEQTPASKVNQLINLFDLVPEDAQTLVTNHSEDVDFVLEKNPAEVFLRNLKVSDASFITLPMPPPDGCSGMLMNRSDQALFKRSLARGLFLVNTKQFKLFFDTSCKYLTPRASNIHSNSMSFSGKPKTVIKNYIDLIKSGNFYYGPNFDPSSFRISLCRNAVLKNGQRQSFGALGMPWIYMDSSMLAEPGLIMHEMMHTIGEDHTLEPQDAMACNNVPYLVQNILSCIDVYDQYGNLHPILNAIGGTDYRIPVFMSDGTLRPVVPSNRGLAGYFFNNTIQTAIAA